MTTLYKPVPITSAEQAEALPEGAVLFDGDPTDGDTYVHVGGEWHTNGWPGTLTDALDLGLAVTALVPIEAEEEWALIYDGEDPTPCADEADAREWARIDGEGQAPSRRYTTIWEETP